MNILNKISKPTLIIDKAQCLKNIERMAEKAKRNNIRFRPHFKTHNLDVVGEWFRDYDVDAITVSSVSMAEYFYRSGWRNITIAFPLNILEIDKVNSMAENAEINLLLFSRETLHQLSSDIKPNARVFIKIDTGMHRTGILAEDFSRIDPLVEDIMKSERLNFKGFLTHAGHTYNAASKEDVLKIHADTKRKMLNLKQRYISVKKDIIVSCGDTPSCSIADDFLGVDEIRPGNFVYYDLMQMDIGSCSFDEITACVACPVVGKDKSRNEIFIYGGAVHLSKEYLTSDAGNRHYGHIVSLSKDHWSEPLKNTYLARISQEHGIIKTTDEFYDKFKVGDLLGVIPVHSCLAANALRDNYYIL
jgi:D-serine deaminase-like pyridoxal phosphate-dependent protein